MSQRPSGKHWSASQFMLYEQCPVKYRERYVDGVVAEPSLAMLFGSTVHKGLEALLRGDSERCSHTDRPIDHARLDCAYDVYGGHFMAMRASLAEVGVEASSLLYLEGLRMVDQVNALALNDDSESTPECWFSLEHEPFILPVVGAVDLWSPPWSKHGPVIWDFKTTVGSWSQERAEREMWQPILYSWAYAREFDVVPTFKYVVLNRMTGSLDVFDRSWQSRRDFRHDLEHLKFVAEEITEAILDGNFDCPRQHGSCLECGEPYFHGHECRTPARHKLTLRKALVQAS